MQVKQRGTCTHFRTNEQCKNFLTVTIGIWENILQGLKGVCLQRFSEIKTVMAFKFAFKILFVPWNQQCFARSRVLQPHIPLHMPMALTATSKYQEI